VSEAVAVDDLVVRYGDHTAVEGISFTASAGEVLALLGPNGAGKTSTIEVIEGYAAPTSGRVRVLDLDPIEHHSLLARRTGVMLQDGGVYPGIKPEEMLTLCAALYDEPLDPAELLALVGLEDRRGITWRQLSGGEQQRLSLAMALIGRPEVVFLDEPTAGVDVRGRQTIRRIIRNLADDGTAVILCTHELDEAERVADSVIIIDHGLVVGCGSIAEMRADATRIRFSAPPGIDVVALSNHLGVAVTQDAPGEYQLSSSEDPSMVAQLTGWLAANDYPLGDLRAGRQKLEDVFLSMTSAAAPSSRPEARRRRRRGKK
jgi:ABC-2 type transport system ATP-binding protein